MLVSLAAAAGAAPAADQWRFEDLYATPEAFEAAREELAAKIPTLSACRGHLGDDAATLHRCLAEQAAVAEALGRLSSYTSNHVSADTRDDAWQARDGAVQLLWTTFAEATSWVQPELLAVGEDAVVGFVKAEPKLAPWSYPLASTFRRKDHVLPAGEERVLALAGGIAAAPSGIQQTLVNAELPWPSVTPPGGEPVRLAQAQYTLLRAHPDRAFRASVFDAFFGALKGYEGTLGALLGAQVQAHWMNAQARGYPSSVDASVSRDFVPRAVYDTLVRETNAHLPTLHRYFALRKELMGVEKLSYADLYVPLVATDERFDLARSEALALASAAPLGADYVEAMRKGFEGGWIDAYPREGKVGGAYMSDSAYGVHPYVLLNHNDDFESASTLAHEYGHAMHSHLAMANQPFPTASYSTFLAEIASTFNEALLMDHLLKQARTDEQRLFLLGSQLESLRTTYFRQAMFAEVELAMHERVERGEPLTGGTLTALYGDIVRRYHGDAVEIQDTWIREWAYIPHFYYDFYVYQYATSLAASALLSDAVLSKQKGAVDRYLALLKAGGNGEPYQLLRAAGVDLAAPEPYRAVAARMDAIMDEIDRIRKKSKGRK